MPWSDLSDVTNTLTQLLTLNIGTVIGHTVNVVATPPDRVGTSVTNTLSLYLYHVRETAATQNLPGPGSDLPNIATAPLGMDLFYVLTAHQHTDETFDALMEQRLMGYALKTFHDYPVVTDNTTVANTFLINGAERGRGNRLDIELRKIDSEHAFAIWTTGERQFTRLAAYYQVGLVMLDPEPPRRMPGIVVSLGASVTPFGSTVLTGSRSSLSFDLPLSVGGGTQTIDAQPARPFLVAAPGPLSQLSLVGQNLTLGLGRRLVLRNARWQQLAPPADMVPLDLALNTANGWTATFPPDRIDLQIGTQITFSPPDGSPNRTIPLFPGSYAARLEITVDQQVAAGRLRRSVSTSNEVTFGVAPRITGHTVNGPAQTISIAIDPAFAVDVTAPQPLDLKVAIDGETYQRDDVGPPSAGHFQPLVNSILIAASFDVTVPGLHSLRLLVDGVDAQPYWIATP
jgi:hypothetical protein